LNEQVPFQEWQHSGYTQTNSCQSCHMPVDEGDAPITSVHAQTHEAVSRHVFVGGNAFLLRILKDHNKELGVIATADELEASARRTEQQLASQTGEVEIKNAAIAGGRLDFAVTVTNKTGHKFPTAYPARRAWLHVLVRDSRGTAVFESGAPRPDGSVAGNDNDEDALKFEPHYSRITSPDQVQIYESIMGDPANRPTTGLLTATHYLKDNRLLPRGFDKTTADDRVMVVGPARQDADFTGGSDTVGYSVALPNGGWRAVHGHRGIIFPVHWIPLGAEFAQLRCGRAEAVRGLLRASRRPIEQTDRPHRADNELEQTRTLPLRVGGRKRKRSGGPFPARSSNRVALRGGDMVLSSISPPRNCSCSALAISTLPQGEGGSPNTREKIRSTSLV
jgi:hypothetical protein